MFVSPNIFTNLHIIMYILILDFQLVVGWGRNVYLHIGQIMQGSLSLTRGVVEVLLGGLWESY